MNVINAGYQITDHIHVEGSHFALGHNANAPAPYVVWQTNEDLSKFQWGRYYSHKHTAIADMVLRATYSLEHPDGTPLSVDFLADNARESLSLQLISERATETILDNLSDILEDYDTELSAEEIMQNPKFQERAQNAYYNLDHSEEYFSLRQSIRDILEENPQILHSEPDKLQLDQRIQSAQLKQTPPFKPHSKTQEHTK